MDDHEQTVQKKLHATIEEALRELDEENEGKIVASWVLVYELASLTDESSACGHLYGPREMTTWRALGLIEWVRRFCLTPDAE